MKAPETVAYARLADFRACVRKHHYRHVQHLVPAWALNPRHDFDDVLKSAIKLGIRPTEATVEELIGESTLDEYQRVAVFTLCLLYRDYWSGAALQSMAVDCKFIAPLVNPDSGHASKTYQASGNIDSIDIDANDMKWARRLAVTSADIDAGSEYWQRLRLDGQVSVLLDGAATINGGVQGVLYDVVRRPLLKPLKATPEALRKYTKGTGCKICGGGNGFAGSGKNEDDATCSLCDGTGWKKVYDKENSAFTHYEQPRLHATQRDTDETPDQYADRIVASVMAAPSTYFQRVGIVRLEAEMAAARRDTWQAARAMRVAVRTGDDYRNTDACSKYGKLCEYFNRCAGTDAAGEYVTTGDN